MQSTGQRSLLGFFCPTLQTPHFWRASTFPPQARLSLRHRRRVFVGMAPHLQNKGRDLVLYPWWLCPLPQATESPSGKRERGVGWQRPQVLGQVRKHMDDTAVGLPWLGSTSMEGWPPLPACSARAKGLSLTSLRVQWVAASI